MRSPNVVVLALALVACGPAAVPRTVYPVLPTAGAARRVITMTDLEEARDVATTDSMIYLATDDGLFAFTDGEAPPTRIEGLPSDDVWAVVAQPDGTVIAATAGGLAVLSGTAVAHTETIAPQGRVTDLALTTDGTAWMCTLTGLLRRPSGGAWERFGDPVQCTTLAPTPEGQLWVGTTSGLWYVDGDVVREHPISGGIPEGYVRSIVPVLPGQILTLLSGPSRSQIALWDGTSWIGYTLAGLAASERAVGLVLRDGGGPTLLTNERAFSLVPNGSGMALRALSVSTGNVRSFRPALTPIDQAVSVTDVSPADVLRAPQPLAEIPTTGPTPSAPSLLARELDGALPPNAYRGFTVGQRAFAAIANAGIVELARAGTRRFRTRTLVSAEDLQVATDLQSGVWVRAADGDIAKWVDGRLRRLSLPAEVAPQALAPGPRGAYLAALMRGQRNVVRIFVSDGGGWRQLAERTLPVTQTVVSLPFMGVGSDGRVWLGVRIEREDGGGERVAGVVVIDTAQETVLWHRRGAEHGAGSLPVPDEVSGIAFDGQGNAWLASLSGAIRVEEHQAIVFGEDRGVRGEVVTDVVSGEGRMWIASAEGLGAYAERRFDYGQPEIVRTHRPVALATDGNGHLWAAGPLGLLQHDGTLWLHFDATSGLPSSELRDVEVDGQGRVWALAAGEIYVLAP